MRDLYRGAMDAPDPRFRILFVCTGNQCRSALAEAMTRSLVGDQPVVVASAGTRVFDPMPSPTATLKAAASLGYELNDHLSRPLDDAEARSADLVIGFELAHVATAVVERGTDQEKTWLLPQLVSALEAAHPGGSESATDRARALIAAAHEGRVTTPPKLEDQIADPIGRSARVHQATAVTIERLCSRMVDVLFPVSAAGPKPQG